VNAVKYETIPPQTEAITKIRYKDPGTNSTIEQTGDHVSVLFHRNVSAIAPGQSAVFYEDDDVIGGGFIMKEEP
jgi:tRNA-specific 2-thiouridylase